MTTPDVLALPAHLRKQDNETATEYRDRLLLQWEAAKKTLDQAKAVEMELRTVCAKVNFPDPKEGTNRVELGAGYSLKMVRNVDYTFSGVPIDKIEDAEDAIAAIGNEGAFLVERLFKWTCEPVKGEYKKLDPANPTHAKIKAIYDKVLVTKDGAPKMEIEAPKTAKA